VITPTVFGGPSTSNRTQFEIRVAHFSSSEMPFKKGRTSATALSRTATEGVLDVAAASAVGELAEAVVVLVVLAVA
jgi:hypothetical protein